MTAERCLKDRVVPTVNLAIGLWTAGLYRVYVGKCPIDRSRAERMALVREARARAA